METVKTIIDYFNSIRNTRYKYTTSAIKIMIESRLEEGFTFGDFKIVIDKKAKQWLNNETMVKYFRPETLFCAKHFQSYLNELEVKQCDKCKGVGVYTSSTGYESICTCEAGLEVRKSRAKFKKY